MGGKKNKSKKKKRWEDDAFPIREEGVGFPVYAPIAKDSGAPDGEGGSPEWLQTEKKEDRSAQDPPEDHNRGKDGPDAARQEDGSARAAVAEKRTWDLAERYLGTLEAQLQAKDQQLHALNERLQDAFDMQRALALLIKAYERRTGLLADAVWDDVPEDELGQSAPKRKHEGKSDSDASHTTAEKSANGRRHVDHVRSGESPPKRYAESTAQEGASQQQATEEREAEPKNAGGAFTQWLRQTGAKTP